MKPEPRAVWAQRVQRLADSGLTAKEFASEIGVNVNTLAGWRWRLSKERPERSARSPRPKFVEVAAELIRPAAGPGHAAAHPAAEVFEVVLLSGLRIRVPRAFDPSALRTLVSALEVH